MTESVRVIPVLVTLIPRHPVAGAVTAPGRGSRACLAMVLQNLITSAHAPIPRGGSCADRGRVCWLDFWVLSTRPISTRNLHHPQYGNRAVPPPWGTESALACHAAEKPPHVLGLLRAWSQSSNPEHYRCRLWRHDIPLSEGLADGSVNSTDALIDRLHGGFRRAIGI